MASRLTRRPIRTGLTINRGLLRYMAMQRTRLVPNLFCAAALSALWCGVASAAPQVGDKAPDFTLASPDGEHEVTLSGFTGKRPVVLVFGSYT